MQEQKNKEQPESNYKSKITLRLYITLHAREEH